MIALVCGCLWLILANVLAMLPSRDNHWRAAYGLIAIGVPLLGWVTWTNGPLWGLAFLIGGGSILRWPLMRLWRRLGAVSRWSDLRRNRFRS